MREFILSSAIALCVACQTQAQSDGIPKYRDFPIVFTIQFHAMNMPFRNLAGMFSNIGFGIGTEFSYNGRPSWVQQLSLSWNRNRAVGNGILLYTQMAWRPEISGDVFTEIKAGAGYLYSFRPVPSFTQKAGIWESVGHRGKGMLTIPVGASLGYRHFDKENTYAPFVSYQVYLATGYSKSIPVVPGSFMQVGARIHP